MEEIKQENLPVEQEEYTTRALAALESQAPTTMELVENAVFGYTHDQMKVAMEMTNFQTEMQKKILEKFDDYTPDQQITVYSVEANAANERIGKLLGPTSTIMTARETALIQSNKDKQAGVNIAIQNVGSARDDQIAEQTPPSIIKGTNDAYLLINALAAAAANIKKEGE